MQDPRGPRKPVQDNQPSQSRRNLVRTTRPVACQRCQAQMTVNQETDQQILEVLREVRDGQREALRAMEEYRDVVKEQIRVSQSTVQESVTLQRVALKRQRTITLIAPGIVACIAAIA